LEVNIELSVSNCNAIVLGGEDIADDITILEWMSDDSLSEGVELTGDSSEELASVVGENISITVCFSLVFKTSLS